MQNGGPEKGSTDMKRGRLIIRGWDTGCVGS